MPKITFFSADPGNHKFITPIISRLEDKGYVCELFNNWTPTDADIYWFDFCDNNLISATNDNPDLLSGKRVIARLHAVEYYMGYHHSIDWRCVSDLIFVSEHLKRLCGELPVRTHVIHNGIDLDKLTYAKRDNGLVLGYAGNIVPDKGIMTMLHYFRELHDLDGRYKLKLVGLRRFNGRNEEYYQHYKQGLPIEEFEETGDIDRWLDGIDYLWQPSYAESFSMIVGEAMAKGIKPLINNFYGAKELWPMGCIYNSFSEFNRILHSNYDSKKYFNFVADRYSLDLEMEKICSLLT